MEQEKLEIVPIDIDELLAENNRLRKENRDLEKENRDLKDRIRFFETTNFKLEVDPVADDDETSGFCSQSDLEEIVPVVSYEEGINDDETSWSTNSSCSSTLSTGSNNDPFKCPVPNCPKTLKSKKILKVRFIF